MDNAFIQRRRYVRMDTLDLIFVAIVLITILRLSHYLLIFFLCFCISLSPFFSLYFSLLLFLSPFSSFSSFSFFSSISYSSPLSISSVSLVPLPHRDLQHLPRSPREAVLRPLRDIGNGLYYGLVGIVKVRE